MRKRKNYYSILGVDVGATLEQIKSSYRRLARKFHPDVKDTSDVARFREIQEAFDVLSDGEKRWAYDLAVGSEIPVTYGPDAAPFAEVWPEPMPTTVRPQSRRARARVLENDAEIVLSPEEARQGGTLSFEVRIGEACPACEGTGQGFMVWCWDCDGTGELRRYRRIRFDIPPGVEHGDIVRTTLGPGQRTLKARVLISQVR
ncbi:MAG: DnaJ domain-containing protein [Vicinamibacteria bacterium]